MAARVRKKRPNLRRLGVSPPLTRAEVRQLKARAEADLRSISNYVSHLVAQDLKRAGAQGSGSPPAASGKREPYSIALYLTASEAAGGEGGGGEEECVGVCGEGDCGGAAR